MAALLILLFAVLIAAASAKQKLPGHFFPMKLSSASELQTNETSVLARLSVNFTLFKTTTNYVVVNENGLLSYPKGKSEIFPREASTVGHGAYISIFWSDLFLSPIYNSGKVQFQEFTHTRMLKKAKDQINDVFECEDTFEPESVFVATWRNMRTRHDCVLDHSIEFCDCLASGKPPANCICRLDHSNSYCDASCSTTHPDGLFCTCLDESDNRDYCDCLVNQSLSDCSCIRDHDKAYCDCLAQSNDTKHASNCSCVQKHSTRYCGCMARGGSNHDYCTCQSTLSYFGRTKPCNCYLYRTKSYCDCFMLDKPINEGYCDCVDQGKDPGLCECIHELYPSFDEDNHQVESFCECVAERYGIENYAAAFESSYCLCAARQDPSTCEEDEVDRKRETSLSCLQRAQQDHLVSSQGNTFQIVLVSGGGRSFVIYNYGYFSSGIADLSNNSLNLRYYSAFLVSTPPPWSGTNRYYAIPYGYGSYDSGSPWCLLYTTNSCVPGQFMYKMENTSTYLEEPDCSLQGSTVMKT